MRKSFSAQLASFQWWVHKRKYFATSAATTHSILNANAK
jgi:hypothetical protein